MNSRNVKINQRWVYLPLLFCSSAAVATDQSPSKSLFADEYQQVNNAHFDYVGGNTRIGVGIDTEFDGTADFNHVFSESKDTATSGGAWVGFDLSGDDKGVNAGGVRLNHHWVSRDAQGRPLRVNKVFAAYDKNTYHDDRATIGYGQEIDKGFWESYVGKGLSGKRKVSKLIDGRTLYEKGYEYNVGGQVGTFLPGSNIRVRGGLDYAWDNEYGTGEDKPEQFTISAGFEKFFQGTPHSVSLDVATSRNEGGYGKGNTDSRANLSYHYDFGGADIYQSDREIRRVRVEVPGHAHPGRVVRQAVKTPYKKAVKMPTCQMVKSTVELGSDTFFKPNSSKLIPSAKKRLDTVLAQIHRTGYKGNIRITGNTCDIGTKQHNQILSERRASAVKRYLIKHGFNRRDIIARGLGETRPKYPNTKGNRHKNRRVDIEYVTEDKKCQQGYKTVYKTAYKTTYKNVRVQQAGISKPSVTWRTEVVQSEPGWVKRALHNPIRHNRNVRTYQTTAGSSSSNGLHSAPVLANDTATTTTNTPVTINVLENDTGNGLTITHTAQPTHGSTSIANGAIVYTPDAGFIGGDSFTYTVTDASGSQAQATVNVTVRDSNAGGGNQTANVAPSANDDSSTTTSSENSGQPVTIDVLENDVDPDGDTLTVVDVNQPQNGTADIVNNQVVYTPEANFAGTDTFSYIVSDGQGHTAIGTVRVTVTHSSEGDGNDGGGNGNVAPVAHDDVTETAGEAVTINVLNNDTDADNDNLTIVDLTDPSNGSVSIDHDHIIYTPEAGFAGTDTFTYTISDGHDHQVTATVTVTVMSSDNGGEGDENSTPVATDDSIDTEEGHSASINVLDNDSDVDDDDLMIIGISGSSNGTALISQGNIVYTPDEGFSGTDSFTYTITDGHGHQATATVTVTVIPVDSNNGAEENSSPIANDDSIETEEGQSVMVNVVGNDTDADGDTLEVINVSQPDNGFVSIVDNQVVYTPNNGFSGPDSFMYTVTDGQGHTSSSLVSIGVNGSPDQSENTINVPPVAEPDHTTLTHGSFILDVLKNDNDVDGDKLSIIAVNDPRNGHASVVNQMILYTPNEGFSGLDSFSYTISDGMGHTATSTVSVNVDLLTQQVLR